MSIEAMKMALEFVEWLCGDDHSVKPKNSALKTREALRQAIEQTEKQEPVAWGFRRIIDGVILDIKNSDEHEGYEETYTVPLYTALPKREWVGLNEKETADLYDGMFSKSQTVLEVIRCVEIKLKEKNTTPNNSQSKGKYMTRDDIIRMAIQSGVVDTSNRGEMYQDAVCKFANLVVANTEKREQIRYDKALKAQCAAAEAVGIIREREKLSQPKHEWVGLTDIEIIEMAEACDIWGGDISNAVLEFAASISAKLKEKNNG